MEIPLEHFLSVCHIIVSLVGLGDLWPCSQVRQSEIILYWKIELWVKWVPDPFCPQSHRHH